MYLPPIRGVLLIDCWDVDSQPLLTKQSINYFYQNILYAAKALDVECVINAMTRTDTQLLANTLCAIPTRSFYSTEALSKFTELAQVEKINHWYVVGQSWQMCVHNNDIGLKNLSKLPNLSFYANLKSFLKINGNVVDHDDFVNDSMSWNFVPRFGYQLIQGVL
jgi:hypothetical protein